IVAVEVNASCPNLDERAQMFAHRPETTAAVVEASACGLPLWVKLSPNVGDLCAIAGAALDAGAEALTVVNTLLASALDPSSRSNPLGHDGCGLSGPPLAPVALRAVRDCRRAFPHVAIVGVGGVFCGEDAAALLIAGADAVQVGTATFYDPRAPWKIARQLERWCGDHGVGAVADLVSSAGARDVRGA
ncbi:MAG: dihydroorotate dehydrogenase, partial [Acidimicrobiales bacterium]